MIGVPFFLERPLQFSIVGKTIEGALSLFIQGGHFDIFIHHPENTTYNFTLEDYLNDTMHLNFNVSSTTDIDTWWYTLKNLRKNIILAENVLFVPNTTNLHVLRWENELFVFANISDGQIQNTSVQFFVYVPNSAPILGPINEEFLTCETTSFRYPLNATDIDEDALMFEVTPSNPFFVYPEGFIYPTGLSGGRYTVSYAELVSLILREEHVGNYELNVTVTDNEYSDFASTSIEVIEVNNPPIVANIGTHTVWTQGEDSTFSYQVRVIDSEDGTHLTGDFIYELIFLDPEVDPFFDISEKGYIQVSPNESQVGTYNLRVCVTDEGLDSPPENIDYCIEEYGLGWEPATTCIQNFTLTVTNENRPPEIINYNPGELYLSVLGTDQINFDITKYDPDGTIPDSYWYVDGSLKQYIYGTQNIDRFSYSFGCGVYGTKQVVVNITDGLLNDSLTWEIDVEYVSCDEPPPPLPPPHCLEKWVCEHWDICQKPEPFLDLGLLTEEDILGVRTSCNERGISEENCGFQIRECLDIQMCNNRIPFIQPPPQLRACLFSTDPNCFDKIQNCHSGSCEIGVDCGGPCSVCPTCSDGIQNQGEAGVDCGGPCPWLCPKELPFFQRPFVRYLLIIILLILVVIVIIRLKKIIKIWKEAKKD
ncbi:hypothetical protein K0A97_02970 [Patescibacteria group bacterium]|nr:hypothetical protein [Patescibacteria group bacterium]